MNHYDVRQSMSRSGPYFVGIGAQKSGTTYLFRALGTHRFVRFPALPRNFSFLLNPTVDGVVLNTLPKEIQFIWGHNRELSWDSYLSIFADAAPEERVGEISPAYAEAPIERIEEFRSHCPEVKLFAIFRNPVERDWSAIRMIANRQGVLDDNEKLMRIARFEHIRSMGDYTTALKRWLGVFPREAFYFDTTDRLGQVPHEVVAGIIRHIGLDPEDLGDFLLRGSSRVRNGNVRLQFSSFCSSGTLPAFPCSKT